MKNHKGSKKSSDGRVTTMKKAIDNNPAGRTVPMSGAMKGKNSGMKKKGY